MEHAGKGEVHCPNCGHRLSMWQEPILGKGELAAMRVADAVASWAFAGTLLGLIAAWVVWNVAAQPFEPYPVIIFAVLSAALATVAALQGALVLLTQRRAAQRDRAREGEALRVAMHAEVDLHRIEQKIDGLIVRQEETK